MILNKEKNNIYTRIYIITDNYINNIKNIIENTTDKKEIKKYTKWFIFIKYIKIIFKLYHQQYHDIHYFIKNTDLLCGNSKIISQNNTLLFYNVFIPDRKLLCSIKKYIYKNDIDFINDVIYDHSIAKNLYKMTQNIYYILYNNNTLCWLFKNDSNISKLKYNSSNLSIIYDKSDIYI